jgi:tripartite-type tricarboxylate transporter receptor subunit TctC
MRLRPILAFVCSLLAFHVEAQSPSAPYPSRPVKLVVPYPPGGTTDIIGRILAEGLTARFKQSFVVDNRPGAAGQIGTDVVAKAPPDGLTLSVAGSGPVMFLPGLSRKLPYDVLADFDTIANLVTVPNIMIVNAKSPFGSLTDLVQAARAHPGKFTYGSAGIGSSGHLAGELLSSLAGIQMRHVPYKGSAPATADLVGGQIDVMFDNLPASVAHVRAGRLRAVAVLSNTRSPEARNLPTTAEQGVPGFVIASSTGLLAPAGTSKAIISALESAMRDFSTDKEMSGKLAAVGADIDFMDAAQYRSFIQAEIRRWGELAKKANISL